MFQGQTLAPFSGMVWQAREVTKNQCVGKAVLYWHTLYFNVIWCVIIAKFGCFVIVHIDLLPFYKSNTTINIQTEGKVYITCHY